MSKPDYKEELRGLIHEVVSDVEKERAKERQEERDELLAKAQEQNSELKSRIEALESQPARKVKLKGTTGNPEEFIYKGYDMRYQGQKLEIADEDKKERFAKFMVDMIKKAAMQEGTASEGGYLVPDEYEMTLITLAERASWALQDCDVYTMSTDTLRIPTQAARVSVYTTSEETALTASDPTFGEVALQCDRIGAYTTASNQLLMDAKVDVVSEVTKMFADSIGYTIDYYVLNGNGSGFTGVYTLSGASGQYVSVAPSATSATNLSEMIAAIEGPYTRGAKWYMHRSVFHYIRSLKDTANNPIFAMPGGGVPGTIYEYPYVISEAARTAAQVTDNNPFIVFANMKNYAVGRRVGFTTLALDPYGKFLEEQTRFRASCRFAGAIKISGAFSFARGA